MDLILRIYLVVLLNMINITLQIRGKESKDFRKTMILINSVNKKNEAKLLNCDYRNFNSSSKSCQSKLRKNTFMAGVDTNGKSLFICRVKQFNELIPGKFSSITNKCTVTYNKKEFHFNRYQLLVESKFGSYKWIQVKRPAKKLPNNTVLGGNNIEGYFYYISQCRVRSENSKFISEQLGKVYWNQSISEWIATVPFSGQEIECFDYSVLTMV